jgi:hypothetical protein
MKNKIRVRGAGLTSQRQADKLVKRGRARWRSDTEIEIIAADTTSLPSYYQKSSPTPMYVNQHVEDAYPGMPILWTIGYRRATAGVLVVSG